jgi:hypothetical protein
MQYRIELILPQIRLFSNLGLAIGHLLQYLFFFLNLPQHSDFRFFDEQSLLHPLQADLFANSVIEMLEAKILDLSAPQKGQTIQVFCRMLPHSRQSSKLRMCQSYLGYPKRFRAPLKCEAFTAGCAEQTSGRLASHLHNGFIANKYG